MNSKAKTLFHYIVPALGGLFVTYLYNVVDGIFVGRGVGAAALGAVNIAVPFITSVVAIAAMFPMGGATVVAIRMGARRQGGREPRFYDSLFPDVGCICPVDHHRNGVFSTNCGPQRGKRIERGNAGNGTAVSLLLLRLFCSNAYEHLPLRLCA